jgi:ligand-binding sensor protein
VLRNELSGYARLKKANDELNEANGQLAGEIRQRQQAEDSLQKSNELLQFKLESILVPDVEISGQELRNFLDAPAIQSLMEDFTRLTGMVTAILDLKGTILVATGWQDICTKYHRIHPETARYCLESDLYLTQNLKAGEYVFYKCKNGLWDVVTPFYVGGKHLGNIYAGQFFYEDEPVDTKAFEAQAARYGFDQEDYMAALLRVPRVSRSRVNTLMDFLVKFSNVFSKLNYSNLKLAKAMLEKKRIEEVLRKANEELGERVAEIEKKKAELERMNKLFVGRELRMIELKDKIKELERKTGE